MLVNSRLPEPLFYIMCLFITCSAIQIQSLKLDEDVSAIHKGEVDMYKLVDSNESRSVVGGNGYIYRCWDRKGKEYWDRRPNSAGCINTVTGKMEKDSKNPQRK